MSQARRAWLRSSGIVAVLLGTVAGAQAEEPKLADTPPATTEETTADSALTAPPTAAPTSSPSASSESGLRGDGRIIGFVSTPYGGNQDGSGLGFGIGVNFGWGMIPITLGFDLLTDFLGGASSLENVQTGNTYTPVRQNRTDKAYFFDLSLRLQPSDWWARPYLEGVVGTKLLSTQYTLSFPNSGTSTSSVTDHDWAGSIGWGAGVDFGGISSGKVDLMLGVRRLNGGEATFSREVDAGNGPTTVQYRAPTSTTFWMLGVVGSFGGESAAR